MSAEFQRLLSSAGRRGQAGDGGTEKAGSASNDQLDALELVAELRAEIAAGSARPHGHDPAISEQSEEARPYTLLNMIVSVDGRATAEGRSGPLGSRADRRLFHALRTLPDAVLLGARTLRIERYNRIVEDPSLRALRIEHGLAAEPLACIVSSSGELDRTIPLLSDAGARVVLIGGEQAELAGCEADVKTIRGAAGARVELASALCQLRSRFGVGVLLCEGGPHLAMQLIAAGLLDELLITLSPLLIGGDIASSPVGTRGMQSEEKHGSTAALALLSGAPLNPPVQLQLAAVASSDSFLFLRYRVGS